MMVDISLERPDRLGIYMPSIKSKPFHTRDYRIHTAVMMGTLSRIRLNEALGSIQVFMMRKRETRFTELYVHALLQDTVLCIVRKPQCRLSWGVIIAPWSSQTIQEKSNQIWAIKLYMLICIQRLAAGSAKDFLIIIAAC